MSPEAIRRGILLTVRTQLNLRIGHLLIDHRPDDAFLVSYPRSGNTWLRSMLVKVLAPEEGVSAAFNGAKLFGISLRNTLRLRALPSPRIIKSHTWYRSDIPRAVYLIRDGRDSLVSWYHFAVTKLGRSESFADFFDVYSRGGYGQRWQDNVGGWLDAADQRPDDILIVRFEEMKKETVRLLGEVTRFLGVPAGQQELEAAVEATSIDRLRVAEKERFPDRQGDQSAFRGGKTGQWRDLMTPDILERFMRQAGDTMRRAGYE
jgi:hypothetical protein